MSFRLISFLAVRCFTLIDVIEVALQGAATFDGTVGVHRGSKGNHMHGKMSECSPYSGKAQLQWQMQKAFCNSVPTCCLAFNSTAKELSLTSLEGRFINMIGSSCCLVHPIRVDNYVKASETSILKQR